MTERLRQILRGKNVAPKTADEAAVAMALENAGGGGGGGGESNVVLIPFTLTADPDTGAIKGSTNAAIADAAAALAANKILIADSTIAVGAFGTNHLRAIMTGLEGDSPAFRACVPMLNDAGTELGLYAITWTGDGEDGVDVRGGKVAVTSD